VRRTKFSISAWRKILGSGWESIFCPRESYVDPSQVLQEAHGILRCAWRHHIDNDERFFFALAGIHGFDHDIDAKCLEQANVTPLLCGIEGYQVTCDSSKSVGTRRSRDHLSRFRFHQAPSGTYNTFSVVQSRLSVLAGTVRVAGSSVSSLIMIVLSRTFKFFRLWVDPRHALACRH